MGCDIHGIIQHKRKDSLHWLSEHGFPEDRNYILFAVLAGMLNGWDIVPIAQRRGLPDGLHDHIEIDGEGEKWLGDHSFSWLSVEEINQYDWGQILKEGGERECRKLLDICNVFLKFIDYLDARYEGQDVRLVFGFDN